MKRRDFLRNTVGAAGAVIPGLGLGAATPCPPSTLSIAGGTTSTTACVAGNAATDWAARSGGTGVVWAIDFSESPGAVEKFILRSNSTPADWTALDTTQGIQGRGALRQYCGAGARNSHKWPRPFSPLPADSQFGLPADPGITKGIGGNATGVQWPYSGERPDATNYMRWRYGLYGHSAYWSTTREYASTTPWEWIQKAGATSRDFWLQVRTKMGPTFFQEGVHANNDYRGKHVYIDLCGGGNGELVSFAPAGRISGGVVDRRSRFYTNFNGYDLEEMIDGGGSGGRVQPGSPWANTCIADQFNGSNACWWMPENQWFTMLFHVIPGRQNSSMLTYQYNPRAGYQDPATVYKDTQIEVYAHRQGEAGYTLIHRRLLSSPTANDAYAWVYSATAEDYYNNTDGPKAFNEFEINAYMGSNNDPSAAAWERWYDQIIFSHDFIPCPNDGMG